MIKILHYTGAYAPAWKLGGPVRSVSQICEGLALLGHQVSVFTTNYELEDHKDIIPGQSVQRNGVTVTYFPASRNLLGVSSREMESAIRMRIRDFDLVHVTGVWQPTSVSACRAAKLAGIPLVISPRGALGSYSWTQKVWKKYPYWWLYERNNCRTAAAIHYTTTMEAEECRRFRFPGKEIIIPNSVGLDFWQYSEEGEKAYKQRLGVGPHTSILLNAGRLHHKKGLDLLPLVLKELKNLDWIMVFAGNDDDDTKTQLVQDFATYGLSDRVFFYPTLKPEELRSLYSASRIFLLPSRHENFGNVVIEAMACGCSVVISDQVGVAEDLVNFHGVSIVDRSADKWTTAIRTALTTSDTHSNNIQLAKKFSSIAVTKAIESLYQSLIKLN